PGHGFNALTGQFVDMVAEGIIDPAKVTRSALENAASIAGMVLTTETLIAEIPEEEPPAGGAGGGGMGMPPMQGRPRGVARRQRTRKAPPARGRLFVQTRPPGAGRFLFRKKTFAAANAGGHLARRPALVLG